MAVLPLGNEAKPNRLARVALEDAMLTRDEQDDLAGLAWNWQDAYTFAVTDDGIWIATSVADPATMLTADSADDLRLAVRADYFAARRAGAGRVPVTDYLSERMST